MESWREPSYSLSELYCSYFGVALDLILQMRFTGFGNWIAILKARYLLDVRTRLLRPDRSLRRMKMAIYAQVSAYFWPLDGRAARNNCRSRRIASHKNRMTSASAASGAARVRSENRSAPPSSAVAMTELPRPPVKMVDLALSIAVTPCVRPAMPPPAITAAVHFTIAGRSVITAADTTVPATSAAGVAKLSSRLSTPGT